MKRERRVRLWILANMNEERRMRKRKRKRTFALVTATKYSEHICFTIFISLSSP